MARRDFEREWPGVASFNVMLKPPTINTRVEFESRLRAARRIEWMILVPWLLMFFLGPFWLYGMLLGGLQRVLQARAGLSYDFAAAVTAVVVLASWFLPPLPLFFLRARAGLVCPHCGLFRTPFRFATYALQHGICPKCKRQVLVQA
jgi:hypothetical protein